MMNSILTDMSITQIIILSMVLGALVANIAVGTALIVTRKIYAAFSTPPRSKAQTDFENDPAIKAFYEMCARQNAPQPVDMSKYR
jgi:hypothetical protein